jgi:hypothetical protein
MKDSDSANQLSEETLKSQSNVLKKAYTDLI